MVTALLNFILLRKSNVKELLGESLLIRGHHINIIVLN